MLVSVRAASDLRVPEFLFGMATGLLQLGNSVDGVNGQTETIGLVVHSQLHWCVDIALLLISPHVERLVRARISQSVDQPGIAIRPGILPGGMLTRGHRTAFSATQ